MRTFRWMLELMALCCLLAAGGIQLQQVDFDLDVREQQDDLRLRDYVISHDLEYVKSELIALQKERWTNYVAQSNRSWQVFLLVLGGLVLLIISKLVALKKRGGNSGVVLDPPAEQLTADSEKT